MNSANYLLTEFSSCVKIHTTIFLKNLLCKPRYFIINPKGLHKIIYSLFAAVLVVLTPIYYIFVFCTNYLPMLSNSEFMNLYNKSEMLFKFFVFNILALLALFGFSLYILYLFFKKKSIYPSAQIAFNFILLVYGIIVIYISKNYLGETITISQSGSGDLIKFIIWYLYLTKSRRVKNTFVN
ncbi:MAG: hypothetical protein APF77_09375 [Clostridia bacterium BRH_c25]|nr:MAG: hypothetical protein APF77_09375 [Clostridia bacterium BRH_c25]